ncbi:hypothetical protein ADUPG1_004374, partial [Aduncisulcus paluster]
KALRIIEAQPEDAASVIQHIKEIASESEYHAISSNEFEQTIEAQVGQIEDFASRLGWCIDTGGREAPQNKALRHAGHYIQKSILQQGIWTFDDKRT